MSLSAQDGREPAERAERADQHRLDPVEEDDPHRLDPVEQAMEIFVYAPLGFVLEAHRLWPQAVARGRREISGSRDRIERRLRHAVSEAEAALRGLGLLGDEPAAPDVRDHLDAPAPNAVLTPVPAPRPDDHHTAPSNGPGRVDPDTLAIPDYDSLSASQVVPRLAGLDPDELELVRVYELAGRGRNTILSRIAQLQAG